MVLVIDDDDTVRDAIQSVLEFEGYTVLTACNGRDAINTLLNLPKPALILLDLAMPEMNGFEFLAHVSRDSDLRQIPIVVTSATAPHAIPGVKSILRKPFDCHHLLREVTEHFSATTL